MPSPIAVGDPLIFDSLSSTGFQNAFYRPGGGYTLLTFEPSSSGSTRLIQSVGSDGLPIGTASVFSVDTGYWDTFEGRLDGSILWAKTSGPSSKALQIDTIYSKGNVSTVYSVTLGGNATSSSFQEFDVATSAISNEFVVVRNADVNGALRRVIDIVGEDNIVNKTTTVDTDLSSDLGVDVLSLSDGRYLVTWSEYYTQGRPASPMREVIDRVDVRGRLVDATGNLSGPTQTLATTTFQFTASGELGNISYELDALKNGGFALDLDAYQGSFSSTLTSFTTNTVSRETISLWKANVTSVAQTTVVAVNNSSTTTSTSNGSSTNGGIDRHANLIVLSDGSLLYAQESHNYDTNTYFFSGQHLNGIGEALDSPLTAQAPLKAPSASSGSISVDLTPLQGRMILVDTYNVQIIDQTAHRKETVQLYDLGSTKDFSAATGAVHTDLTTSGVQAVGRGFAAQSLAGITDVIGGAFGDVLIGNASANRLVGGGGDDTIRSGGGSDVITGGAGDDTAVFDFSLSAANIVRDGKVTYVVGPTGTTKLESTEHLAFMDGSYEVRVADTRSDLDANGTSDILLQAGGSVVRWSMKDGLFQSGSRITDGAGSFAVKGTGDFDGDGTSDVLLQNGGSVVGWTMKNGAFSKGTLITDGAAGYDVKAIGDFNGDGTDDIVLQNNGSVVLWTMKDGAYHSGSMLTSTLGSGFSVVGAGDFNGDGTDDILLQKGGTVVEWLMQGGAFQSGKVITDGAGAFKVVGVGDFSGDGTDDILLQNGGSVVDWIMQGGSFAEGHLITTGGTGFDVRSVGDYNGDGTEDIALQNGGTVVNWIMHAGQYVGGNVVTSGLQDYVVV